MEFFTSKKDENPIKIVLLRWYDEVVDGETMYGCPRLLLTDQYTCVYLDAVDMSVHIISRSNCENEYFVNKYIF